LPSLSDAKVANLGATEGRVTCPCLSAPAL